jgi:hypothetical protein
MANASTYPVIQESTRRDADMWVHDPCGTILMGVPVVHPIHDSPFPGSGSGQTSTEIVPYCPKCEAQPDINGEPISEDPRDAPVTEVLSRMSGR